MNTPINAPDHAPVHTHTRAPPKWLRLNGLHNVNLQELI